MNPAAMEPFGAALLAYFEGDANTSLIVRRDDGREAPLPASHFFREESAFTELEKSAIALCRGTILDIGAGAGSQSLALQRLGHRVTAIDISPQSVAIVKRRGVADVHCADVMAFAGGPFDTLLMLGHGIGMVETIDGLRRFLAHTRQLVAADGQLLLDSLDVRLTVDRANLEYHEANRESGRYIGEIRMQFEFRGTTGPYCGWLQLDPDTLRREADLAGWDCSVVHQGAQGDYLARLTPRRA